VFGRVGEDDEEAKKLLRSTFSISAAVGERSEQAALAAARMLFGGDVWATIKFMNGSARALDGAKPVEKAELSDEDLQVVMDMIGGIEAGVYF